MVSNGTAGSLGRLIRSRNQEEPNRSEYFYYGKTGTIKGERRGVPNDKLFMLLISEGEIEKMSASELKENKFYILFYTGYKFESIDDPDRWQLFMDILTEVEDSYMFRKYMNE